MRTWWKTTHIINYYWRFLLFRNARKTWGIVIFVLDINIFFELDYWYYFYFKISPNSITAVRKFACLNDPGCLPLEKPKISYVSCLSDEMKSQFEIFFSDKANITMSSYRIDPKTKLPLFYLQDQKSSLWKCFSETYPNGMGRITFMIKLQKGLFKYRNDLGSLYSICAKYGYSVFSDIIKIIKLYIEDNLLQVSTVIICIYN